MPGRQLVRIRQRIAAARPANGAAAATHLAARADRPARPKVWPILLCGLALGWRGTARSEDDSLESRVKAIYLCKLPAFVAWPPNAQPADTFILCVVGRRPFGDALEQAAQGQTVDQRPIVVRWFRTIAGNPGCQSMFVSGSDEQSVAAALAVVRGKPVLTVTDGQSDPDRTGIVNFVLTDGHVRFEIDQRSAADDGLVISSKLLSLAARVRTRSTP